MAKSKAAPTIFTVLGVSAIVVIGYYVGLPLLKKLTANTTTPPKAPTTPQQPQSGAKPGSGGGASGSGASGSGVRNNNGGLPDWATLLTNDIANQIGIVSDHTFGQQQDYINGVDLYTPDFTGQYSDPFTGDAGTQGAAIDDILGAFSPSIPDYAPDSGGDGGYDWGSGFGDFGAGSSDFGGF